jgi:adenine-specific DNA-methyltransferase
MDELFGLNNFRGDITRIKCNPKNFKRKTYGNIEDLILFYTKTNNYIWNEPRVPLSKDDIERSYAKKDDKGQRYTTVPLHAPGETKNEQQEKSGKESILQKADIGDVVLKN